MHRRRLIGLLEDYGRGHPAETAVVGRFLAFVREHERCFERDCFPGHVTGSAWLVNGAGTHVLLTHHKKLDRWLQLGGHADGEADPLLAAMREAEEESGLVVEPVGEAVFDVDIHEIPARGRDPVHLHYDVRFALRCRGSEAFRVSDESHDLAWVPVADLSDYTREESVLRMARKWAG
ncbi:MAG: NUDIX domain-containing protein [Pseudomonadales bacterium]|nr:NUDIX hydrolase [Pseudomonadales bacterium]NIX08362.1 NUDIX domain-containing protein [Pseudomonadales bacterium]